MTKRYFAQVEEEKNRRSEKRRGEDRRLGRLSRAEDGVKRNTVL